MPAADFMVEWEWRGPDNPEIDALIARERAVLEDWRREGALRARFIAADESRGWLVLRESDAPALAARLDRLPLRRWLDIRVTPLGN